MHQAWPYKAGVAVLHRSDEDQGPWGDRLSSRSTGDAHGEVQWLDEARGPSCLSETQLSPDPSTTQVHPQRSLFFRGSHPIPPLPLCAFTQRRLCVPLGAVFCQASDVVSWRWRFLGDPRTTTSPASTGGSSKHKSLSSPTASVCVCVCVLTYSVISPLPSRSHPAFIWALLLELFLLLPYGIKLPAFQGCQEVADRLGSDTERSTPSCPGCGSCSPCSRSPHVTPSPLTWTSLALLRHRPLHQPSPDIYCLSPSTVRCPHLRFANSL